MAYIMAVGDIAEFDVDIIVNASNGIGYMGGLIGRIVKLSGVAESIHYKTRGRAEREAKAECRKYKAINGRYFKAGDVFYTDGDTLKAKYIIHAVTTSRPGTKTTIQTVQELLPKILELAIRLNAKSMAIPLLGTGNGGLNKEEVMEIYNKFFSRIKEIDIKVVRYN